VAPVILLQADRIARKRARPVSLDFPAGQRLSPGEEAGRPARQPGGANSVHGGTWAEDLDGVHGEAARLGMTDRARVPFDHN